MKFFTSHRWIALLLGLILLAWSYCPGSLRLEDRVYSVLMSLVPESSIPGRTVVVTLNTGDKNTPAAISYARLADLLRRLESAGVKAIGLDIPLDHSQTELDDDSLAAVSGALKANKSDKKLNRKRVIRQLDPDGDLREALTSAHNIVLGVSNVMSGDLPVVAVEPPDNKLAAMLPLCRRRWRSDWPGRSMS